MEEFKKMKRFGIAILAALMVVSLTIPAWAIESQFGGYWRTRFFTNQNFTGEDQTEAMDFVGVDTRTRLYYTAIFHENLKFVNKFEFNTTWGDTNGGDIGADGTGHIRVKNSYADFNTGPVNWKVGIQGAALHRGFLVDDDFSGVRAAYMGDTFSIPFLWIHANEGFSTNAASKDSNDYDVDYYGIYPTFSIADMLTLTPSFTYVYSKNVAGWPKTAGKLGAMEELNLWFAGLDADADLGMGSAWFTFIYEGGDVDPAGGGDSTDFGGYLVALGGSVDMGMFDIHGQGFYASGDDDAADNDEDAFWVPAGQSYYWSEIMGYGIFDRSASRNAPADQIGNVWAVNLGATVKPMDKLKVTLDLWYAALAEDIYVMNGAQVAQGTVGSSAEDVLGTEVDLVITYELVQNLNLDVVGAYLFAGDATTQDDPDDANPYEIGARLSLSF